MGVGTGKKLNVLTLTPLDSEGKAAPQGGWGDSAARWAAAAVVMMVRQKTSWL